jgi:hypothetical protein
MGPVGNVSKYYQPSHYDSPVLSHFNPLLSRKKYGLCPLLCRLFLAPLIVVFCVIALLDHVLGHCCAQNELSGNSVDIPWDLSSIPRKWPIASLVRNVSLLLGARSVKEGVYGKGCFVNGALLQIKLKLEGHTWPGTDDGAVQPGHQDVTEIIGNMVVVNSGCIREGLLRRLSAVWARALKEFRQPARALTF